MTFAELESQPGLTELLIPLHARPPVVEAMVESSTSNPQLTRNLGAEGL